MWPLSPAEWGLLVAGAAVGLFIGLGVALGIALRLKHRLRIVESSLAHRTELEREREQIFSLATERLSRTFDQLAQAQFQSHSETFLKLARESLGTQHERAKGELKAREQAIENLLRPIRETMHRTEQQLHEIDKARRESHGSITSQLHAVGEAQRALGTETRNLVKALRRPEVRGQWGEITLQRVVELAGMQEHCDFVKQSHTPTESGSIRPDMLINLPEGRQLVVDVKTPLDAYLEATEAEDEPSRKAALMRHSSVLAKRIQELSSKSYWSQFENSPEFVILFIPGDQFLSAALGEKPDLLDTALRQNIILATPTSLVALLKAIAYGWQQVALTENAAQIRSLASELYERLATFTGHIAGMGRELDAAIKAYNRGVGSFERMVLPSARRFTELGIKPKKEIPTPPIIETALRETAGEEMPRTEIGRDGNDPEETSSEEPSDDVPPSEEASAETAAGSDVPEDTAHEKLERSEQAS
jgi:DNA recombination protein RmuC